MREGKLKKSLFFSYAKWKIQKKRFSFHARCEISHFFPFLRDHSVPCLRSSESQQFDFIEIVS